MARSSLAVLDDLIESFDLHLDSRNLSARTRRAYNLACRRFRDHLLAGDGVPPLADITTDHVHQFVVAVREQTSAITARTYFLGLQQFFRWLSDHTGNGAGELTRNPMAGMRQPKVEERQIQPLAQEEIKALIDVCAGSRLVDRRDRAMLAVFIDTGIRLNEMAQMRRDGLNKAKRVFTVMGKGRKERSLHLNKGAVLAIDAYLRARNRVDRYDDEPMLWVGLKGPLTGSGIYQVLRRRARAAGMADLPHPHQLRHTSFTRFLDRGGSVEDLANMGGWTDKTKHQMAGRYTSYTATQRAHAAHEEYSPLDGLL
jgi:site-specific recombinase XerD